MPMKATISWILVVLFILFAADCTVQQRRYMKGYYTDSRGSLNTEKQQVKEHTRNKIFSSMPAITESIITTKNKTVTEITNAEQKCDTVYQTNGVKMIVLVTRVYKTKTYYKLCDSENEAEFTIETSRLKRIIYASGKTDSLTGKIEDPENYYKKEYEVRNTPISPASRNDINEGLRLADESIYFLIGSLLFLPLVIVALIKSTKARRLLRGKRGYEKAYTKAGIVQGFSIGCAAVFLFFLILIVAALAVLLI